MTHAAPAQGRLASLRQHTVHAGPVLALGVATVVGSLAAFAFQVIAARTVGPEDFGQLAAFLALINVAALASVSLQNATAVGAAEAAAAGSVHRRRRPSEATILGLASGAVVAASTPLLVPALGTTPAVVLVAAAALPLTFWVAEAVGVLQGAGRSTAAVWWTTNAVLARVALVLVCLVLGLGVGWVLGAVVASMVVAMVGAGLPARRLPRADRAVFSPTGVTVLLLSLLSAWLVNSDVIVVRASSADAGDAGAFASAAVLVKAAFIIPSALSIYMLPRFVRNRDHSELIRIGQWAIIGATGLAVSVLVVVFWLAGEPVARLVFGGEYAGAGGVLLPLLLAYLPWVVAQTALIRLTADASRPALTVLAVAAVTQVVGYAIAVPSVTGVIWVQAVLGVAVLVVLLTIARRPSSA